MENLKNVKCDYFQCCSAKYLSLDCELQRTVQTLLQAIRFGDDRRLLLIQWLDSVL
ncbi:hypothetical protein HU200_016601 [Digitaria exilis]|uniref:Uncharacterized protein n=1 Tax=Digitaria exilis TaxID=1010633 RepID=A0A835F7M6_9POAL|nr:hypothetical protein HU200_016601 [Digitaria exilis]